MTRLYRVLLHLYPASFRREYGGEMTSAFAQAAGDATWIGTLGLLFRAIPDEIAGAIAVHWSILVQDVRYSVRTLNRTRGFALTAILVTALGVGANTAAFSAADFVLFRPLPFPDGDRLVRLCEGPRTGGGWGCMNQLSPGNYRDFKNQSTSFESMGVFTGGAVNLVGSGDPRRLNQALITQEVLPVLGVAPALGRVFEPGHRDDNSVIISDSLWQSQFSGDPTVIGRKVNLSGAPFTIIGVMPASFYFPTRDVQVWTPLVFQDSDFTDRTASYIEAVGRLKSGVTFEQARVELAAVADRLRRAYPDANAEMGISFYTMRDNMSPRFRIMLLALGGASLCLLLLTCANLANLFLARAASRERELAVRAALGAGRERLVRQLITQSATLTILGGAAGVLVAFVSLPLFSSLVPPTLPIADEPVLDVRALGLAALFTGLTGLGFGLFPAFRAGRAGFSALREGTRAGGGRKQRLRAILVTVEVTMTVILLIASGVLIRAVWRVQAINPGFDPQNVLTLRTELPRPKYESAVRRDQFYHRVLSEVRVLPGVQSAAYITSLPLAMIGGMTQVEIPGRPMRPGSANVVGGDNNVMIRFVTPQYFKSVGIPLQRGRDVEESDTDDRQWVAVVSASFVARHLPGEDPIGKTFLNRGTTRTIIGVVGDIKFRGLERSSEPQMYIPSGQVTKNTWVGYEPKDLVVKHSGPDAPLISAIRGIVATADPEQPISNVRPLDTVVAGETASRRAQLQVLLVLATLAVVLACVGIYGLLAYTVSLRSQEIGVRLALGAGRPRVGRMIFADGMRLAVIGIVPGVFGGYWAARGMNALLFGVAPSDPLTFATAAGLALVIAFAGSLVPTLRAVRVMPVTVLRSE